jgi:hypothetical protein
MHHLLGQSVFDIDGKEAWGETFLSSTAQPEPPPCLDTGGTSITSRRSMSDGS